MKFALLNGRHVGPDGRVHQHVAGKAPPVIESEEPLDRMFAGKFKRVDGPAPVEEEDDDDELPESGDGRESKEPEVYLAGHKISTDMKDFGDDVTARFPGASENDLRVFKRGRHFDVLAEGEKEPLRKGLTRKKLDDFLETYKAD